MAVFLVSAISPSDGDIKAKEPLNTTEIKAKELVGAIKTKFSEEMRYEVDETLWLVRFDGPSRELSLFLGSQAGAFGGVLIAEVTSLSGYGPSSLTAWFKSNFPERESVNE